MRLFRRRNDEATEPADAPAPGASGDGRGGAGGNDDVARPEQAPTGDWMLLPPVKPTASPTMPTTFRVQTLPEILTSHQDTRLSGSLGHAVSADAPGGSVDGLTSSVAAVSPSMGHGELTLREPHHEHHEDPAPAPVVVHRLASTDPVPLSNAAVNQTHLPPPIVSRTLANPAPASSTPAGSAPLPVMRVVDTSSSASASTPSPSPSSTSGSPSVDHSPETSSAPIGEDFRVGGFEVPLEQLTDSGNVAGAPLTSAPAELAPPIQSRRVQRRVDPGAPVVRVSRVAEEPTSEPEAPTAPLVGDTDVATTAPVAQRHTDEVPAEADTPVSRSADLTLRAPAPAPVADAPDALAPPIQRLAEPSSSTAPSTPAALSTASPAGASDDVVASRTAEPATSASSTAADAPAVASDVAEHAPLVGETDLAGGAPEDLATTATTAGGSADVHPPASDLPLVEPAAARGSSADDTVADETPPTPTSTATSTAPTLGAGEPIVPVQTLADGAAGNTTTAPAAGRSALPLANTELQPGLAAPSSRPTPTDGPAATAQRRLDASPATTSSPLSGSTPAPAAPMTDRPLAGPTAAAAALQRRADGAPATTSTSAASTPPPIETTAPTLGSSALIGAAPTAPSFGNTDRATPAFHDSPALVRPVASMASAPTVGVQRSLDTGATTPLSSLGGPAPAASPSDATPAVLRRLVDPADALLSATGPGVVTPATLAAPVQRSVSPSPTTSTSSSAPSPTTSSSLPLHTPAASIPTAADVAVKAGLAERAPDGSLLYSSPPVGAEEPVDTSFTIQRVEDDDAGDAGEPEVQRVFQTASPSEGARRSSISIGQQRAPDAGGGQSNDAVSDAKALAEEARKLYPYIRNALEADMRRQLEGRSRSSRFRP